MGLRLFSNSRGPIPNPNPHRFTVVHSYTHGGWLVLTVKYPDATTFKGNKILVYAGFTDVAHLLQHTRGALDPHFVDDGVVSPTARFPADKTGHALAKAFVYSVRPPL